MGVNLAHFQQAIEIPLWVELNRGQRRLATETIIT